MRYAAILILFVFALPACAGDCNSWSWCKGTPNFRKVACNGDSRVICSEADIIAIFAEEWMKAGRYDFNGDGIVDSKDLALMADKWKRYRRICGEKEHGITVKK